MRAVAGRSLFLCDGFRVILVDVLLGFEALRVVAD